MKYSTTLLLDRNEMFYVLTISLDHKVNILNYKLVLTKPSLGPE